MSKVNCNEKSIVVQRLQSAIIQGERYDLQAIAHADWLVGNATYAISSKNIDFTPLTNTSGGVFLRKYRGTAGTPLFGNGTFADVRSRFANPNAVYSFH